MILLLSIFIAQQWLTTQAREYLLENFVDLQNPLQLPPAPKTLKYVFAISRAGTRTPKFEPYPNFPSTASFTEYWGAGKGELTKYGEQLMTALGTSLASRYKDFIKTLTKPRIVTTADVDKRTVKSAQLVSQQLFGDTLISSTETEYMDKYRMFAQSNPIKCKKFEEARKETMEYLNQKEDFESARNLQKVTGVSHPLTPLEVMEIVDTLDMQKANYKYMSEDLLEGHRWNLADINLWEFVRGEKTPLYDEFTAGPLFHQIFKELEECGKSCRGFHFHMTHALTLSVALLTLHLSTFLPIVGTTVLVELHEDNEVTILLYQPMSWEEPGLFEARDGNWVVVAMHDLCGYPLKSEHPEPVSCGLNTFRKNIPDWSPRKWKHMCR